MGQRRRARECALQMLFQIDLTGTTPPDVFGTFWTGQEAGEDVRAFAERLVLGVSHELRALDRAIAVSATNWRIERMAVVDRNVLRMAVYEMLHDLRHVIARDVVSLRDRVEREALTAGQCRIHQHAEG